MNEKIKPIIEQDECSPDSYESFEKELKEITGKDVFQFRSNDKTYEISGEGGFYTVWINGKYVLEISADFPFYGLYRLQDRKESIEKILNEIRATIDG